MQSSYILGASRTPLGKFLGALTGEPAPQLAAIAIRAALAESGLTPKAVQEVIMGIVLSAGIGQAPARQAALAAEIPSTTPALTINKVCGSGLKAVMLADQSIRAGDADVIVAGGMENMSRAPHLTMNARGGWKFGSQTLLDSLQHDGLWCAHENKGMGSLADATAAQYSINRERQDAFAAESHRRAVVAQESGKFGAEIAPVSTGDKKPALISCDEGPRADCSLGSLARLKPVFGTGGTATAGNSSQISDGAAALVVTSRDVALVVKSRLKARIVACAVSGTAPKDLFIAPVQAIEQVLQKASMTMSQIDLVELNEAFASQVLACCDLLGLDLEGLNVHGGAIALGHPIGASGARVLVTLLHALEDRRAQYGLAALCLGGGNAVAMIVERLEGFGSV